MNNDGLCHYTSTDVFFQMLNKVKEDNSADLTFWASNVHYMNDPHELDFLFEELHRVLPELEKEVAINEKSMPFSYYNISNHSQHGIIIALDNKIKEIIYKAIYKNVYAISFSRKKDYLPMWSLYGSNGGGVCLVFDYEKLKSYYEGIKVEEPAKKLVEIKYDIKDKEIWHRVKELYEDYYSQIILEKENSSLHLCKTFVANVLLEFSLYMKHHSYSYEEEVRLIENVVYVKDLGNLLDNAKVKPANERAKPVSESKIRVKNGRLVPYKEIKIPISCLSSVIVGPTINSELQCEAMKTLLKRAAIDIDVIPSTIPYRLV